MGSRIMHYAITAILADRLKIADSLFLLGGIAPDVHKHMNEAKEKSHFLKCDSEGIGYADYGSFYDKYLRESGSGSASVFHLGYFFHLISDDIWLKDIYYKKIKWLPQPEKKEAQAQCYRDFRRLNGKLIDHYRLQLRTLDVQPVAIDEIHYTFLPGLIQDLTDDFDRMDIHKHEDLELLQWEEVIDCIEHSAAASLTEAANRIRLEGIHNDR
ncbi:hypothetical protein [Paenibacillus spongiae]|uniref:Zinc dependent phospholipase C family protein n=1 Tax=Paenibacillus spongiae TaxID=2909671 RepID=A0ABY5S2B2_9BACL|nr:hypothetical protein [Paenibacillus spongiae]UVI28021.1 hypothetical protein L1F29_21510 [Paenibacillus spongiae]